MIDELKQFLDSEVNDYGLSYEFESVEFEKDNPVSYATVKIKRFESEISVNFRSKEGNLQIEFTEDLWYDICEYNHTVKYFWMIICPVLFSDPRYN